MPSRPIITSEGNKIDFIAGKFINCSDSTVNQDVVNVIEDFYKEMHKTNKCTVERGFNNFVRELFKNREPKSLDDFTDETFAVDCKITNDGRRYTASLLKNFYTYLMKHGYGKFNVLNVFVVNYNSIIGYLLDGYKIYSYNPTVPHPPIDKWIIYDGKKVYSFDFSDIENDQLCEALKQYIWIEPSPCLETKYNFILEYKAFISIVGGDSLNITFKNIMDYKQRLSKINSTSLHVYLSKIKDFVSFINLFYKLDLNEFIFEGFSSTNTKSKGNKNLYTKDQMKRILDLMAADIKNTDDEVEKETKFIKKSMAELISLTPVRCENIQDLKLNSIEKINDTELFYLHYNPKNYSEDTIPLIAEVHNIFKEVIDLTNKYRDESNEKSDFIFIYKRSRGGSIDAIANSRVSDYINEICKKNGLPMYGTKGIRNHFMDKATKSIGLTGAITKENIAGISRHSANVHFQSYADYDINQVSLNMYGIKIGETDLKGVISLTNPDASKRNLVLGGRGNCTVATCEDKTLCDCLMCKRFKTTPCCIPFFEKEIKSIEERIYNSTNEEEIKFLNSLKALNIEYLFALYKKKSEKGVA